MLISTQMSGHIITTINQSIITTKAVAHRGNDCQASEGAEPSPAHVQ